VVDFLTDLRLDGSQRVLGAIAIALAENLEAAPLYSQAKFARELREIMAELRDAETNLRNLELLEGLVVSDKLVLKALASLNDMSVRQLEVAGERLMERRDTLHQFGQVFLDAANERDGGFGQSRYHLENAIDAADDRLLEQIEHAEAPFWAHVRHALAERNP